MRILRGVVKVLVLLAVVAASGYGYLFWQNNRTVAMPDRQQFESHFQYAVQWMEANRADVEASNNRMLWWMVKRAAEISHDPVLERFYADYKRTQLDEKKPTVWRPLFDTWYRTRLPPIEIFSSYPDYNLLFLYGLSCDRNWREEPIIQAQFDAGYCPPGFVKPACATHHLMGVRFMQQHHCLPDDELEAMSQALLSTIERQLVWDPRAVDVYIQRVMMMVDSAAREQVQPVWITQVLQAQNRDGGWGGFDPLFPLTASLSFGMGPHFFGIQRERSDFHATAQGVLLLALLLNE